MRPYIEENMMPPISDEDLNHVLQHVSIWNDLRGAKLFITGGTGFFGAWLLETFCHANTVLLLHATATVLTRDPQRFLEKMPHLRNRADLQLVAGDVRALRKADFGAQKFSHVIHAATASGVESQNMAPLETFDTIVEGTRRALDFTIATGAQKFLYVSSGAVYGPQPRGLSHLDEDFAGAPDAHDFRAAYGNGKRAGEWLCAAYREKFGLDFSVARGFAFVGPHLPLDAHFAIGNFLRDAMNGGPIRISGDGTSLRSYLYAADLAIWLWEILGRGQAGRAYNVGSEKAVSILGTAQIVAKCFQPQPEVLVAGQAAEGVLPLRYVPNTQRAQSELELQQRFGQSEALSRTLKYLQTEVTG